MRLAIIFVLGICSQLFAEALDQLKPLDVYSNSSIWPSRVRIADGSGADDKRGGGFPGMLIRIEENLDAIVDFGRDGIVRLPLDQTDVLERAQEISRGAVQKELPNFVAYTANMFVKYSEPGRLPGITPESMLKYEHYMLIYCNSKSIEDSSFVAAVEELNQALLESHVLPLYVPTDFQFYNTITEVDMGTINMMVPHMAIGSLNMLSHNPEEDGTLVAVLIDQEGKIFKSWRGNSLEGNAELAKVMANGFIGRIAKLPDAVE